MESEVDKIIEEAVQFGLNSPFPSEDEVRKYVFI